MDRLRVGDVGLHLLDVVLDVPVGQEDVGPAVEVVVEEERTEGEGEQAGPAHAGRGRGVHEEALALVVVEARHLVGEVADDQAGEAAAVVVGGVDAHGPARAPVLVEGDAGAQTPLLEGPVALVAVEAVGLGVVGHRQVRPAVAVEVEGGHAQRLAAVVEEAGVLRHVLEARAALVAVEAVGRAGIGLGRAVGLVDAVQRAADVGLRRPAHVVAHVEVGVAVAVVVQEGGAAAEAAVLQARGGGGVAEARAVVEQQAVAPQRADEEVGVAVVVHVGGRRAQAVALHGQAGRARGVLERPVAAVAIERGKVRPSRGTAQARALHEEEILVAVAVGIEEDDARAHRLRQVLLAGGAVVVAEGDPGFAGHLTERRRRIREGEQGERQEGRSQGFHRLSTVLVYEGLREGGGAEAGARASRCSWMGWRSLLSSGLRRR